MGAIGRGRPSFQEPPNSMGVYRILSPKSQLTYIGSAVDLSRRGIEHSRPGGKMSAGDRFCWQSATPDATIAEVRAHEAMKIAEHNPPLNHRGGGGGRLPNK